MIFFISLFVLALFMMCFSKEDKLRPIILLIALLLFYFSMLSSYDKGQQSAYYQIQGMYESQTEESYYQKKEI
jgi:hypothetical protein